MYFILNSDVVWLSKINSHKNTINFSRIIGFNNSVKWEIKVCFYVSKNALITLVFLHVNTLINKFVPSVQMQIIHCRI